eukprot:1194866-Prorocentrum_minimum.AAC.9
MSLRPPIQTLASPPSSPLQLRCLSGWPSDHPWNSRGPSTHPPCDLRSPRHPPVTSRPVAQVPAL